MSGFCFILIGIDRQWGMIEGVLIIWMIHGLQRYLTMELSKKQLRSLSEEGKGINSRQSCLVFYGRKSGVTSLFQANDSYAEQVKDALYNVLRCKPDCDSAIHHGRAVILYPLECQKLGDPSGINCKSSQDATALTSLPLVEPLIFSSSSQYLQSSRRLE